MKHYKILTFALTSLFATVQASAQGTVDDYRRAFAIRGNYSGKIINSDLNAQRIDSTHRFWYTLQKDGQKQYMLADADANTVSPLFDTKVLVSQLSAKTGEQIDTEKFRPANLFVKKDNTLEFTYAQKRWTYTRSTQMLDDGKDLPNLGRERMRPQPHWMVVPRQREGEIESPDKSYRIFWRDDNLWTVRNGEDMAQAQPLTTDGDSTFYYSGYGTFSPDGKYYATIRIKPAPRRYVYYVESSPAHQLQPKLHKQEYAKPGDSLDYRMPVIIDLTNRKVIQPDDQLFHHQYEVSAPRWDADSKAVTFEFNQRGHHCYRLLELGITGQVRSLIEETNDKYVNYGRLYRHDFEDGKRILWTSERDGYNNIYLYERTPAAKSKGQAGAKLVRQLTKGGFYVRDIVRVDEENGVVYFTANGATGLRESDRKGWDATHCGTGATTEDPYLIHYYKINLNGRGLTCLTPEEGHHAATFTDDMQYLIDTYSTVTSPPVTVLRSAKNGAILQTLAKADISALEAAGWKAPEVFVAPGRDGKTPMWGLIQRPSNFDPSKTYPVIEYIYSGPGDQYVPKHFTPWLYNLADIAELGFIVVQLDAMSTSFRSRAFEEVCYKNLKDSGFPDRIAWIKAAAAKYPYMDANNVGIYGCSAGGQEALGAVLFHGDFYKAAYAACGCHDNRMDKIWWNEQWMSYPIDSSYVASSNTENAAKLERPLMLVVGELDDNVDPASTMQVVNALEKAGKDFELVVIPGAHHTMGESFGEHKRYDFFVRNLLGVNPPKWSELK